MSVQLKLSGPLPRALRERYGLAVTRTRVWNANADGRIVLRREPEGRREWYCLEEDLPEIAAAFMPYDEKAA